MKIRRYARAHKILSCVDKFLSEALKVIFIPFLFVALYGIYDVFSIEIEAIKAKDVAKSYYSETDDAVDFKSLKEKNPEIIAWIKIPDTSINYPVMQGSDNRYYLTHDFERNFATVGGIFLDYRNDANFLDNYSVVYGHRMSKGRMFSDVGEYADKEYFKNHGVGMLYTESGNYELRFVAFASVYGDEAEIYNIGAYRKEEAVEKIMQSAKVVVDGFDKDNLGDVILLSTCSTEELMLRDVLLAEKVRR